MTMSGLTVVGQYHLWEVELLPQAHLHDPFLCRLQEVLRGLALDDTPVALFHKGDVT